MTAQPAAFEHPELPDRIGLHRHADSTVLLTGPEPGSLVLSGLTDAEAHTLFLGSNNIHAVVGKAMAIAEFHGEDLGLPEEVAALHMDGGYDRKARALRDLHEYEQYEAERRAAYARI